MRRGSDEADGPGDRAISADSTWIDAVDGRLAPRGTMPSAAPADDSTWIDALDDRLAGHGAHPEAPRAVFAPPPAPVPRTPFAPAPPKEALARQARTAPWSRAVGDGGPPAGLDALVVALFGLNLGSLGVWWRADGPPVAHAMLLPLLGAMAVTYFFWKGRNWARFLLMLGAIAELCMGTLGFALLRSRMTGIELALVAVRMAADVWVVWFCVRPDTVAFFERRAVR